MPSATDVFDRQSALDFLFGRINYERTSSVPYRSNEFKLDRMRTLLAGIGDPHWSLPAVHIAGTKGKGSTAGMMASILSAAGYKVGSYTSPHLEMLEERIRINGVQCSESEFVRLVTEIQPVVERMDREPRALVGRPSPTFFEITTAMAMLHFARERVDAAVFEVGLGGRLDSTNVCQPIVCGITSISFDHTKQLGNTLAAIAAEKAGIIKPGIPVVSGVLADEPREVIASTARAIGATLVQRGRDFDVVPAAETNGSVSTGERFSYVDRRGQPPYSLTDLTVGMLGQHQTENAAVAVAMARQLAEQDWRIGEDAIRQGLASTRCAARIEVIGDKPLTIVDVAHNLASVEALVRVIDERFPDRRRVLIFASSRDKDTAGMLRTLLPQFDRTILTRYVNNPRAIPPEELQESARQIAPDKAAVIDTAAGPVTAWEAAKSHAQPDDLICVTGSFFLAAEIRPLVV